MNVNKVIAKENLKDEHHTWKQGMDYEIVQKDDYFILSSDQGHVNYFNTLKNLVLSYFILIED